MATGSEYFAYYDIGLSQIFELIVSANTNSANVVGSDKLSRKTSHFGLPSLCQKRRVLKLPIRLGGSLCRYRIEVLRK